MVLDANATDRTTYYQLKQVDQDEHASWSDVVAMERSDEHHSIALYPNPASGWFTIAGAGQDVVGIDLLDAAGRRVKHWNAGGHLAIAEVLAGACMVSVERAGGARVLRRLVVR